MKIKFKGELEQAFSSERCSYKASPVGNQMIEVTFLADGESKVKEMYNWYNQLQKRVLLQELNIPSGVIMEMLDIQSEIQNEMIQVTMLVEKRLCRILGCSWDQINYTKGLIWKFIQIVLNKKQLGSSTDNEESPPKAPASYAGAVPESRPGETSDTSSSTESGKKSSSSTKHTSLEFESWSRKSTA